MNSQKPVVHFVFGSSAAGSLKQAVGQLGLDQTVLGFADDLSMGPINPPDTSLRNDWFKEVVGSDDFEEYGRCAERFWDQAISSDITPVVWVCRRCAGEYSGFLEFIWRLEDKPFRVVDITEIPLAGRRALPEPASWIAQTFGQVHQETIIASGLIDRQVTLGAEITQSYREMWSRLRSENAPIRIATDHGLCSASLDHFDGAISACVTNDWQRGVRIVGKAIVRLLDENFDQCGDVLIWSRIRTLAKEGALEMKVDDGIMHTSEVRLRG